MSLALDHSAQRTAETARASAPSRSAGRDAPAVSGPRFRPDGHELDAVAARRGVWFQPKLRVGAVDDPLEREADRVAEQVMRSVDRDRPVGVEGTAGDGVVRRSCGTGEWQSSSRPMWTRCR